LKQSINDDDYEIIKGKYHFFNSSELDDMTLPTDRSLDYYKDQWDFVLSTTSANIILIDALSGLLNGRSENDNSSKNVITALSDLAQKYNNEYQELYRAYLINRGINVRSQSNVIDERLLVKDE
jgi:hypothetical protein